MTAPARTPLAHATAGSQATATPPTKPQHNLSLPQKGLVKLGLRRPIDLALHLPLRYEDETQLCALCDAVPGQQLQFEAEVVSCEVQARGRRQLLVTVQDGATSCRLRFFNFYPSQLKTMGAGQRLRIRGELKSPQRFDNVDFEMLHPQVKAAGAELPQSLTPIYPTVAGLPQAYLRKAIAHALAQCQDSGLLQETLGPVLPQRQDLPSLREALDSLHHPGPEADIHGLEDRSHPAWLRLKAEELLAQQLSQLQARQERDGLRAPVLRPRANAETSQSAPSLSAQLRKQLPFALTRAQERVGQEIAADLARPQPMHRLLQGDVGSGKTVVAALAAALCIDAGHQCALMAPTEILAEQHFQKLVAWLQPLLQPMDLSVAWLTGSQKKKERALALAQIESGQARLVIGTHAVIAEQVRFQSLALALIDEQHRFGVAQRLALRQKMQSLMEPHLLMMSATPIPRTLAMSVYADLDVSTLDELPPGRTPVLTKLIADTRRDEVVQRIQAQIAQGRQVYWVCPLIEEAEDLDLVNAQATHQLLSETLGAALPGVSVGLLHSRLPPAEKKAVMQAFAQGQMAVLVATTVIEVGVDVPNATLMVIEHAERFGLSQLHQLRGRVGRGAAASVCVLLYSTGDAGRLGEAARQRLQAMIETHDGFEIARRDLEIRGPGEFLGARQSGAALLRFADLNQDLAWVEWARNAARELLHQAPQLAQTHLQRWLGGKSDFLKA